MRPTLSPLLLLFVYFHAFSQEELYLPTSTNDHIVEHEHYTLSYSEEHEQAEWLYYVLTDTMLTGTVKRTNDYREDESVSTGSASQEDYIGSGYDYGFLCPVEDMRITETAMRESFLMSNIVPQVPAFKRGKWKELESLIRKWVENEKTIHIVSGGVLPEVIETIGENEVSVSMFYYKVIYDPTGRKKMIALVLPNEKVLKPLKYYVVTVDKVEKMTGIDFFPQLEDELEYYLESNSDISKWNEPIIQKEEDTKPPPSNQSGSIQCKGISKSSGNRCKNKTTYSNGYCFLHQAQAVSKSTSESTGDIGRCMGTMKDGSRCKKSAASGSQYCWQHQK